MLSSPMLSPPMLSSLSFTDGLIKAMSRASWASHPHAGLNLPQVASAEAPAAEGFELMERKFVTEYDSDVLLYKHTKTGTSMTKHRRGSRVLPFLIGPFSSSSSVETKVRRALRPSSMLKIRRMFLTSSPPLLVPCCVLNVILSRRRGHVSRQQRREQDLWRRAPDTRGRLDRDPAHPRAQRPLRQQELPHQGHQQTSPSLNFWMPSAAAADGSTCFLVDHGEGIISRFFCCLATAAHDDAPSCC